MKKSKLHSQLIPTKKLRILLQLKVHVIYNLFLNAQVLGQNSARGETQQICSVINHTHWQQRSSLRSNTLALNVKHMYTNDLQLARLQEINVGQHHY